MIDLFSTYLHGKKLFLFIKFRLFLRQCLTAKFIVGIFKTDILFFHLRKSHNFNVVFFLPKVKLIGGELQLVTGRYLPKRFRWLEILKVSLSVHIENHFVRYDHEIVHIFILIKDISTLNKDSFDVVYFTVQAVELFDLQFKQVIV